MSRPPTPAITRFTRHYDVVLDGCWHWTAATTPGLRDGSPRVPVFAGTTARRWIYRHHFKTDLGPLQYLVISPGCSTVLCVNPEHLIVKDKSKPINYDLPRFGKVSE